MEKVADVAFGVLELGRPEEGVERAHLNADPAIHAQGEVDGEPVEDVALAWAAAFGRREGLLVRVDVDAPVGALPGTEHARGAVLLDQGDHPATAGRESGSDLGVLLGVGFAQHVTKSDAKPLREPYAGYPSHTSTSWRT
jgi:hypothetical protein